MKIGRSPLNSPPRDGRRALGPGRLVLNNALFIPTGRVAPFTPAPWFKSSSLPAVSIEFATPGNAAHQLTRLGKLAWAQLNSALFAPSLTRQH